jgi:hypothetical protein
MITGFEPQTHDLTEPELKMAKTLARVLRKYHVGKKNKATSKRIEEWFKKRGYKCSGPRVRKMMNYIRCMSKVNFLVADHEGYWIAETPEEVLKYLKGLKERIGAQVALYNAIEEQLRVSNELTVKRGQLNL